MQAPKPIAGVNNLRGIIATSPSSRILNLHGLAVDPPEDPEYYDKPLFVHPVLNRSIIVKHNVRAGDEERIAPRAFNATKIIFPFDPVDLNLGGQYMFINQQDFASVLTRQLEYEGLLLDRDLKVLEILDGLPTLDPFLLREVLAKHRFEVAPSYYRFNEPDKAHMLGFVEREIESLVELCFGEVKAGDTRAKRLSQLLLADQDSPDLQPLQLTLRLEGPLFSESMFAWKAFLYYRWRAHALAPTLKTTMRSIERINRRRYDTDGLRFVIAAKALLETTISRAWREVAQTLRLYDNAYEAMTEDRNPETFRQFLMHGSSLFLDLGHRIGRLEQVVSFWNFRLSQHHSGGMSPDDVMEAMRDLLQGLAIWPTTNARPVEESEPAPLRAPGAGRDRAAAAL
jgi:hypothetical protein